MATSNQEILLLGLLLTTGLVLGLGAARIGLPRVAAYVAAGMLFSPDLLGARLVLVVGDWAEAFTKAALGVIAYLIGGSLTVRQIRRLGRTILVAALAAALGAVLLVFGALLPLVPASPGPGAMWLALALAAIAATTAPAATVAVVHEYRARGPVSRALLGVVAVDDAIGIVFVSLLLAGAGGTSLGEGAMRALVEIAGAIALGAAAGLLLAHLARRVVHATLRLPAILGGILLVTGLAESLRVSPLLAGMVLGFTGRAASGAGALLFQPIERLEETVFLAFFTIAGAGFRPAVFLRHVDLVAVYVVARAAGKVGGALGARIAGAPRPVVRWLGVGLLPQAGVAVGLALSLAHGGPFREVGSLVVNVLLAATVVNELVGPLATRVALGRSGGTGHAAREQPVKVAEWIRAHPGMPATVVPGAAMEEVLARMLGGRCRRDVYVVDARGRAVGHIGFRRLARALLGEHRPVHSLRQLVHHVAGATAREMMETNFPHARPGEDLDDVLHRQLDNDVEELLVLDEEHRPLGSVALLDVLRALPHDKD